VKFRKKPIEVEAIRWHGENGEELREWVGSSFHSYQRNGGFVLTTLEGQMLANLGDVIIKGVAGEFYPCKPDIFKKTYDVAGGLGVKG